MLTISILVTIHPAAPLPVLAIPPPHIARLGKTCSKLAQYSAFDIKVNAECSELGQIKNYNYKAAMGNEAICCLMAS